MPGQILGDQTSIRKLLFCDQNFLQAGVWALLTGINSSWMPCAMFLRFWEEMRSVSGLALARHAMMVLWQNNKHQPDNQPTRQPSAHTGLGMWSYIFMLMERDIKESWHKTKQTIERPCKIIFDIDLLDSNDLCEPVARIRSRYEMTANCPDLFHFVEIPWREVSSGCYYCDQLFSHRQSSREPEVHQRIQRGSFRTYIGSPEDPCVQS